MVPGGRELRESVTHRQDTDGRAEWPRGKNLVLLKCAAKAPHDRLRGFRANPPCLQGDQLFTCYEEISILGDYKN